MREGEVKILPGGRLRQVGINYTRDPIMVWHNNQFAIVKWPGHSEWACRGYSEYWPTHWWLLEVEFKSPELMMVKSQIREETPGKNWRKCQDEFLAIAIKRSGINGNQG